MIIVARVRFHLLNKHPTDTCMCMQESHFTSSLFDCIAQLRSIVQRQKVGYIDEICSVMFRI